MDANLKNDLLAHYKPGFDYIGKVIDAEPPTKNVDDDGVIWWSGVKMTVETEDGQRTFYWPTNTTPSGDWEFWQLANVAAILDGTPARFKQEVVNGKRRTSVTIIES